MGRIIYVSPSGTGRGTSPSDPMDAAVGIPGVRGGGTVRLLDGDYHTAYVVRSLTATVEAADGHTPQVLRPPTGPAGVTVTVPPLTSITIEQATAADLVVAAAIPGITILLESGTYTATDLTPAANVTIKSAPGHHAAIVGNVVLSSAGCTLRDIEVRNTSTARTSLRPTSVSVLAADCSVLNCLLFDGGVALFASGTGLTYRGCVTNGQGYQAGDGSDRGHGHSAYIQNHTATSRQTIADNIFGPGYRWSMHAYSQTPGNLTKMDWLRNTAWGAGELTANPHETYTALLAGVAAADYTLSDNYLYNHWLQTKFGSETSDLISGSGGRIDGVYGYRAAGAYGSYWTNTTWVSPVCDPGTLGVYVHANAHEAGRANITVFNPNDLSSTTADCTGIIGASDPWYLYDGFNPLAGPVSSGTGPTVTVPMTGLTCRTPAGVAAPTHPCPKFGAFVVRSTATWAAP